MSARVTSLLRRWLGRASGEAMPPDFDAPAAEIIRAVRPYTMTSHERVFSLIEAVRYVAGAGIPGSFVECGVWRGGSMMAAALTLRERSNTDRELYLFDTFEGMSAPSEHDVAIDGKSAAALLQAPRSTAADSAWCYATLPDVQAALERTGYPEGRIHYVQGRVEDTLPERAPRPIALLRLDTDWYESTRHELEHLWPLLSPGGVLIVDDYGHWDGARRAVDEYFDSSAEPVLLSRIDYTGRLAIKH